jgi:hypothetical protein
VVLNLRVVSLVVALAWIFPRFVPVTQADTSVVLAGASPGPLVNDSLIDERAAFPGVNATHEAVFSPPKVQASNERRPGPLLDIARVVPYPEDFAGAVPDLGLLSGRFYTLDEEAVRTAAASQDAASGIRETKRLLAQAGWLQRYESRLAAPIVGNSERFSAQISSFVVEYAASTDAHAAFVNLTAGVKDMEPVIAGDEAMISRFSGVTTDTESGYQAARTVFRVGPLLGTIVYADLLNQQPDSQLLANVTQLVAARGAVVATRQSAPLGSMILQVDHSDAIGTVSLRDIYEVRAGVRTPLYGEDAAIAANRTALFAPMINAFSSSTSGTFFPAGQRLDRARSPLGPVATPTPTSILGGDPSTDLAAAATPAAYQSDAQVRGVNQQGAHFSLVSALYDFGQPSTAEAWLKAETDHLRIQDVQFDEVPDAPRLGDESLTFRIRDEGNGNSGRASGFRVYARMESIVSIIEIRSDSGISLNGAAQLMYAQIICVDESGCASRAALPRSIFGGVDAPVTMKPRQQRVQVESPTATIEPASQPVVLPTPTPIAPVEAPALPAPETPTDIVAAELPLATEEPIAEPVTESTPAETEEPDPVVDATPPVSEEPEPSATVAPGSPPAEESASSPEVEEPAPSPPVEEPVQSPPVNVTNPAVTASDSAPTPEPTTAPLPAPETGDVQADVPDANPTPQDDRKDRDNRDRRKRGDKQNKD